MAPRHPPESPDDDKPSKLQHSVHRARNDLKPADERPAPETGQDASHPVKADDDELDRIEAYLRGPTAFTA